MHVFIFCSSPLSLTFKKRIDCALLPPCEKFLKKKVQRAHYVSLVWGKADSPSPCNYLDPCCYGWQCKEGAYEPLWFEGNAVPEDTSQIFGQESEETGDDISVEEAEDEPWSDDDSDNHDDD